MKSAPVWTVIHRGKVLDCTDEDDARHTIAEIIADEPDIDNNGDNMTVIALKNGRQVKWSRSIAFEDSEPTARKAGRPKGSKNAPKTEKTTAPVPAPANGSKTVTAA